MDARRVCLDISKEPHARHRRSNPQIIFQSGHSREIPAGAWLPAMRTLGPPRWLSHPGPSRSCARLDSLARAGAAALARFDPADTSRLPPFRSATTKPRRAPPRSSFLFPRPQRRAAGPNRPRTPWSVDLSGAHRRADENAGRPRLSALPPPAAVELRPAELYPRRRLLIANPGSYAPGGAARARAACRAIEAPSCVDGSRGASPRRAHAQGEARTLLCAFENLSPYAGRATPACNRRMAQHSGARSSSCLPPLAVAPPLLATC